jgi:ABC-type glycerol-3-phosphate transport system substrate-binding protein
MQDYVKRFNQKYPKVKVELEAVTDYAGTVRTRMSTKAYGDVLMMVTTPPVPSDFKNFYEPIGTKKDMFAKYDFLETNAQTYFGDYVYAYPLNANSGGLLYNKKVFEKAGIKTFPKSSEEFYAMLEQIKKNTDAVPFYLNYPSRWTLTQWEGGRMAYSGDPSYANKIIHVDSPFVPGSAHYEIYKVLYEVVKRGLVERDILTSDWENSKQMMADGKIGVMNLGSWAIGQIRALAKNPDDIAYMPYPVNHKGTVYAEPALDYNLAINKFSKNKAAAKAFAEWFADESGYAKDNNSIPALKGGAYPTVLQGFKDLGVKFVTAIPAPAGEEGLFDKLDKESEIGFWTEPQKIRIVDAAMGTSKETYDDIMKDWNARWAKARKALKVTP